MCGDGAPQHVVGRTPEELANGVLDAASTRPATARATRRRPIRTGPPPTRSSGRIVEPGEPCRHSKGPAVGGYTAYSAPFKSTETYVGLGYVRMPYVWDGVATGMLAARLFDAAPDGTELLMTRGVYRLRATRRTVRSGCRCTATTGGSSRVTSFAST